MSATVAAAVAALALAGAASANPWDGGLDTDSPGEAAYGAIVSELAGVPARVRCWSPAEWAGNPSARGSLAYVPFLGARWIEASPTVCAALESFRAATPKPSCSGPTTTERYTVRVPRWRYKFVRRNGNRVRVRYRVYVRVQRTRTVPGPRVFCDTALPNAAAVSLAAQTLAHESVHVRGEPNEAVAECHGRQLAKTVLVRLGAPTAAYAFELARYTVPFGLPPHYTSPECRPGGTLDLDPTTPEWP